MNTLENIHNLNVFIIFVMLRVFALRHVEVQQVLAVCPADRFRVLPRVGPTNLRPRKTVPTKLRQEVFSQSLDALRKGHLSPTAYAYLSRWADETLPRSARPTHHPFLEHVGREEAGPPPSGQAPTLRKMRVKLKPMSCISRRQQQVELPSDDDLPVVSL